MDDDIKKSLTAGETWIRGLYMLLFFIVYSIVEIIITAIAIFQFLFLLFTREPSDRLQEFGDDMSVYIYQIWQFLTINSEERPWPFAPWPYSTENLDDGPPTSAAARETDDPIPEQDRTPAGPDLTDESGQGEDDGIKKD